MEDHLNFSLLIISDLSLGEHHLPAHTTTVMNERLMGELVHCEEQLLSSVINIVTIRRFSFYVH